ncbi:Transcriptional regulator, ArsR family [Agrobacterium salinitolerans str. Hayward 0363]|nr:helix-turn-helix transcriptional regulator [Agrobacterium sp. B1(2019)]CVI61610.1 Transcriptional regulator, ArsR family [Agrobacterium salinitolerans str. Hayward 0363]
MIVSLMENYSAALDDIFQSLADPTRRAVILRLGGGEASVGTLAEPFDMALPSFMKHIRQLEEAGLIVTRKQGRVRFCSLEKQRFSMLDGWLSQQRAIWEGRTDRLEQFVMAQQDRMSSKGENDR